MDQRGSTYSERGTIVLLEPGRRQLHAEPHVRPISCHVASLSWQEPEELNRLLPMKVSGTDRNDKVKMFACVEVIVFLVTTNQSKIMFHAQSFMSALVHFQQQSSCLPRFCLLRHTPHLKKTSRYFFLITQSKINRF